MSIVFDDEFHGVGGSYEIRDGKRVPVEPQPVEQTPAKDALVDTGRRKRGAEDQQYTRTPYKGLLTCP